MPKGISPSLEEYTKTLFDCPDSALEPGNDIEVKRNEGADLEVCLKLPCDVSVKPDNDDEFKVSNLNVKVIRRKDNPEADAAPKGLSLFSQPTDPFPNLILTSNRGDFKQDSRPDIGYSFLMTNGFAQENGRGVTWRQTERSWPTKKTLRIILLILIL